MRQVIEAYRNPKENINLQYIKIDSNQPWLVPDKDSPNPYNPQMVNEYHWLLDFNGNKKELDYNFEKVSNDGRCHIQMIFKDGTTLYKDRYTMNDSYFYGICINDKHYQVQKYI